MCQTLAKQHSLHLLNERQHPWLSTHPSCLSESRASLCAGAFQRSVTFHQEDCRLHGQSGFVPHLRRLEHDISSAWRRHCKEPVWSLRPQTPSPPLWCQRICVVSVNCHQDQLKAKGGCTPMPPHFGLGSSWTKVTFKATRKKTAQPISCCHGHARMQWLRKEQEVRVPGEGVLPGLAFTIAWTVHKRGSLNAPEAKKGTKVQGV